MSLFIAGLVAVSVGEILLAFTVITVHSHIIKEHKIDKDVLRTMKSERRVAFYALALIILGTVMQLVEYLL